MAVLPFAAPHVAQIIKRVAPAIVEDDDEEDALTELAISRMLRGSLFDAIEEGIVVIVDEDAFFKRARAKRGVTVK